MLFNHTAADLSFQFDEPNLVSTTGLVPVMALAKHARLDRLAQEHITVSNTGGDKGANAGAKISSIVAGMVAGADSIDDMDLLRHGGMDSLFGNVYAPSTLGSHLREYTHGHVKQLAAVASRFLRNLDEQVSLLPVGRDAGKGEHFVRLDIDDTVIEVYSSQKQGAGIGYNKVRGLNALLVTASTATAAPVILGQQLRKGAAHSVRGADKLLSDCLATLFRMPHHTGPVLVRADSAYYSAKVAKAVLVNGADFSVTVPLYANIKTAIATIDDKAWNTIKYPNAILDHDTGEWISEAEVAEVGFTAFASNKDKNAHLSGRLVVRRIPEKNKKTLKALAAGQHTVFDTYRYHPFFTTVDSAVLDTKAADTMHRQHAVIELVNAELKDGALAHMPSGKFQANAAWLVAAAMTHNLLRATATMIGGNLARARALTLRQKIINIPARIAHRARRLHLHLPTHWKWATAFARLWNTVLAKPVRAIIT